MKRILILTALLLAGPVAQAASDVSQQDCRRAQRTFERVVDMREEAKPMGDAIEYAKRNVPPQLSYIMADIALKVYNYPAPINKADAGRQIYQGCMQ